MLLSNEQDQQKRGSREALAPTNNNAVKNLVNFQLCAVQAGSGVSTLNNSEV